MDNIKNIITKINDTIALRFTLIVGTMWCFYAFTIISILPIMIPKLQNQILYISNCFQLVLLPLIMVGQNIIGGKAEERAVQDHEAILAELVEVKAMHAELHTIVSSTQQPSA